MNTFKTLKNIQHCITRRTAEVLAYSWSDDFCLKYIREMVGVVKDTDWFPNDGVDIQELSIAEMEELGFGLWNDASQLRLIPLWMAPYLNQNTDVLSIRGESCKLSEADNDNRFGCIAYGIVK